MHNHKDSRLTFFYRPHSIMIAGPKVVVHPEIEVKMSAPLSKGVVFSREIKGPPSGNDSLEVSY